MTWFPSNVALFSDPVGLLQFLLYREPAGGEHDGARGEDHQVAQRAPQSPGQR